MVKIFPANIRMHSSTLCLGPRWLPQHFWQTRLEIGQQTCRCLGQFDVVVFLVVFHCLCITVTNLILIR